MEEKTIKERVVNYAKNKYYFHINDLKKYFAERKIEFKEETLEKTVYRLKKGKIIYGAGKGWYSTIKEEFKLDTKPIKKIVTLVKKKFPLLEFSCWSTEQIKGYFHHLPSQFVTFVHADKDFLQSLKDFLSDSRYNVYLNPRKREAEKYVEFYEKTVILRPAISYREPKSNNWAKIEKILVDLFMETKKLNFMDMEEYKKIMSNIVLAYRINIAVMFNYAHQIKIKDRIKHIIMRLISPSM